MHLALTEFSLKAMQWVLLGLIIATLIAFLKGSDTADKLICLSVTGGLVLAFLVVKGVETRRALYLDVALVYDIFGFLGFLAISTVPMMVRKAGGSGTGSKPREESREQGGEEPRSQHQLRSRAGPRTGSQAQIRSSHSPDDRKPQ